jgi:hypothetical protein
MAQRVSDQVATDDQLMQNLHHHLEKMLGLGLPGPCRDRDRSST